MYTQDNNLGYRLSMVFRTFNSSAGSGSFGTTYYRRSLRSGSRVPCYKAKIANSQNAMSLYTRDTTTIQVVSMPYGIGADTTGVNPQVTVASGSYMARPIGPFTNASITAADRNKALQALHERLSDTISTVQTLPFLAEFSKSKALVGKLSGELLDSTLDFKKQLQSVYFRYRSLRNGWKRFIADSSTRYLEWKFGVAPLMSDISSTMAELDSDGQIRFKTTRGVWTSNITFGGMYSGDGGYNTVYCGRQSLGHSTARVNYYVRLRPQVVNQTTRWGLSPASIPGAVWEVTPWSWLVDYFFDVQTFLNQWQYLSMPIVYAGTSSKIVTQADYVVAPRPMVGNFTKASGQVREKRVYFVRNGLPSIPTYVPQLNLAGPFEGAREWNIAALVGTRFTKF